MMNAPPFPLNPSTGDWFQSWVWNGARWVASPTTGLRIITQTFTESGPYMPSPGLVSCVVECIGGGGGGGGTHTPNITWVVSGGGGGSGGYSRKTIPAALVRGGVLVTVGDGGGNQAAGGATSFGAFCLANGGGGGAPNDGVSTWGLAGTGAAAGIGDVAMMGATGHCGTLVETSLPLVAEGGMGGAIFGGNVSTNAGPALYQAGQYGQPNTGAGGSGAVMNQVDPAHGNLSGGNGGSGLCVVTEYCWGDRDQPQPEWRPPLDVNVSFPRPPWPGGQPGPWPPGAWWPPGGWWGPGPWGPGRPSAPGPQSRAAVEFEAGQPYDQSINPETGLPWEDEP